MGVGASGVDRSSAIADEPKGVSRWVERPFAEVHEGYSDGGSSLLLCRLLQGVIAEVLVKFFGGERFEISIF